MWKIKFCWPPFNSRIKNNKTTFTLPDCPFTSGERATPRTQPNSKRHGKGKNDMPKCVPIRKTLEFTSRLVTKAVRQHMSCDNCHLNFQPLIDDETWRKPRKQVLNSRRPQWSVCWARDQNGSSWLRAFSLLCVAAVALGSDFPTSCNPWADWLLGASSYLSSFWFYLAAICFLGEDFVSQLPRKKKLCQWNGWTSGMEDFTRWVLPPSPSHVSPCPLPGPGLFLNSVKIPCPGNQPHRFRVPWFSCPTYHDIFMPRGCITWV